MRRFRAIHLAVFALVGSYLATTGIGAAIFPFEIGKEQFAAFLYPATVPFDWMTTLGSPFYWTLLLSLIVIVPITAFATERFATRTISVQMPEIPTWVPLSLAAAMSAFCIYKLAMAGALTAHEAWDRSVCYDGKILRRIALFDLLGTRFYCFTYSSLPMLGCFLLAQGVKRKDTRALIGCAVVSAVVIWFDIAIMMKAPAIIYIGTLGLILLLCGFGLVRSVAFTAPAIVVLYVALSVMQFCNTQTASWDRTIPHVEVSGAPSTAAPLAPSGGRTIMSKAGYMARAALFRMASGFPYYVQTFSAPDERCGIDHPQRGWLPQQDCFAPVKVFKKMYPDITYTAGYQPAPMNASAYAEAGPWYVLAAMLACGSVLGLMSALARGNSPISISMTVACCIYAYYATQTSLTGSLIDSYGLVWIVFPLAIIGFISYGVSYTPPTPPTQPSAPG